MANNLNELNEDNELDPETSPDPLTDTRTVAQTPTPDEEIQPLPETEDAQGNRSRAGDFDPTTGAAHPSEDSGADKGLDREN